MVLLRMASCHSTIGMQAELMKKGLAGGVISLLALFHHDEIAHPKIWGPGGSFGLRGPLRTGRWCACSSLTSSMLISLFNPLLKAIHIAFALSLFITCPSRARLIVDVEMSASSPNRVCVQFNLSR